MNIPRDVKYMSAFLLGYYYAFYGETWGFGEHSKKEDLNHIPKNIKDKNQWLDDWHYGCAIGVE